MSTFPIRCFTCGKPINQLYQKYELRTTNGEEARAVLDSLGLERMCCRRMFMTHATAQLEKIMSMYTEPKDRIVRIGVQSHSSFEKSRNFLEAELEKDD